MGVRDSDRDTERKTNKPGRTTDIETKRCTHNLRSTSTTDTPHRDSQNTDSGSQGTPAHFDGIDKYKREACRPPLSVSRKPVTVSRKALCVSIKPVSVYKNSDSVSKKREAAPLHPQRGRDEGVGFRVYGLGFGVWVKVLGVGFGCRA